MKNRIDASLSDNECNDILKSIENVRNTFSFLIDLSPKERQSLSMIDDKSRDFIYQALELTKQKDYLPLPPFNIELMKRNIELAERLDPIRRELDKLSEVVDDTYVKLESDVYADALKIYRSSKRKRSVTKRDKIFNFLKPETELDELFNSLKQKNAIKDEQNIFPEKTKNSDKSIWKLLGVYLAITLIFASLIAMIVFLIYLSGKNLFSEDLLKNISTYLQISIIILSIGLLIHFFFFSFFIFIRQSKKEPSQNNSQSLNFLQPNLEEVIERQNKYVKDCREIHDEIENISSNIRKLTKRCE